MTTLAGCGNNMQPAAASSPGGVTGRKLPGLFQAAVSRRTRKILARVVTQVTPPNRRATESSVVENIYVPLLAPSLRQQARRVPAQLAVRYLAFAVKRAYLESHAPDPQGGRLFRQLSNIRDRWAEFALGRICSNTPTAHDTLSNIEELARVEHAIYSGVASPHDLRRFLELAPTEIRLVRALACKQPALSKSDSLSRVLCPAELLTLIADDINNYSRATFVDRSNIYAAFVEVYGQNASEQLQAEVSKNLNVLLTELNSLPPRQRAQLKDLCTGAIDACIGEYPLPAPERHEKATSSQGVSTAVVLFGMLCVAAWLVAYAAIIYRGFADQTFGMPLAALFANLTWEFAYGFLLDPLGDYFHTASIFGFLVDTVIAWQAWKYGPAQFPHSWLGTHFRSIFVIGLAIALPVNYYGFLDLQDPDGEYTGFGINLMMSLMYIKMLDERGNPSGQSMYIALGKWVGTLCAWIATALTVTTSPERTWPTNWKAFVRDSLSHRSYPLTPLINVMYGWTFMLDFGYCVLLYRNLRAAGLSPWRRF